MTTEKTVETLYAKAADYHNITVSELRRRIVGGEKLIDQYYRSNK